MTQAVDSYAAVLRTPQVKPLLLAGVLARLSYGVVPFAIVVAFAQQHGFGVAGIASAALMTGIALLGPWRGRQVDRHSSKAVLLCAAVWVTSLTLLAGTLGHLPWPISLLLVAIAGSLAAPLGAVLRAGWSHALPDKQQLQRIHALDSIIEESTFVVAPLITVLLLNVTSTRWTVFLGAVLIAVAVPILLAFGHLTSGGATKTAKAHSTSESAGDTSSTAAATKRQRSLLWDRKAQGTAAPIAALGVAGGGIAIILPALAQQGGRISSAGFGFAAFSLGGVLGGLLYGRWKSEASLRTKYQAASAFLALALLTLYLPGGTPVTVAAVFVTGLAVTPLFVIGYLLLDQHFSDNRHTEANALLGSGYNLGSAMGSTLGGLVLAASGVHLTVAILTAAAATGFIATVRLPKGELQEAERPSPDHAAETAPNLTAATD